jgi:hypothetical protein
MPISATFCQVTVEGRAAITYGIRVHSDPQIYYHGR